MPLIEGCDLSTVIGEAMAIGFLYEAAQSILWMVVLTGGATSPTAPDSSVRAKLQRNSLSFHRTIIKRAGHPSPLTDKPLSHNYTFPPLSA